MLTPGFAAFDTRQDFLNGAQSLALMATPIKMGMSGSQILAPPVLAEVEHRGSMKYSRQK